ncbi:uncharacterized protein BO80DRAFT_61535 [Aspergillus ibericus CBS 121593]|uniref:Uncharacterized protein n=1 Tax=Aspergillus ibericus CBS 121593 TaxID=1448316 RepID=A0A395H294_9EURO|nr:hypothetical protein BO80DRAFT_61535 [Aspergillus ibericus CBS 121593]RAL01519.1 hypothetical protein BO80DRAFT_61535 [Aspergillus ibericus CBS 121593]
MAVVLPMMAIPHWPTRAAPGNLVAWYPVPPATLSNQQQGIGTVTITRRIWGHLKGLTS